ncbi:MAG: hypothetical protein ACYTGH_13125 [Planctomycetota bacterium]|jgi:predicted anti-sigma-YlaC factor YlaD
MKCEEAILIHLRSASGETTPAEERALNVHLEECPACSEEVERVAQTLKVYRNSRVSVASPSKDIRGTILHRSTVPQARRIVTWLPRWEFLAVAAAALLVLFLHISSQEEPKSASPHLALELADSSDFEGLGELLGLSLHAQSTHVFLTSVDFLDEEPVSSSESWEAQESDPYLDALEDFGTQLIGVGSI